MCCTNNDDKREAWKNRDPIDIERFKLILENMNGAFIFTESVGNEVRVVYTSLNLVNPFSQGEKRINPNNNDIWSEVLPEDIDKLNRLVIEAAESGEDLECTYRVYNAEREVEWRSMHGSHLPDSKDGIHRMIHVITDITELKKIEAEQREKDRIIDFAMKNTDVNLWYFDYEESRCQLTASCQKAHEMPGVETLDNFPECLFNLDYVREDCIELLRDSYKRLQETGESLEFDVWFRKSDGTGWWCERDMLSPLVGPDGRVTRGIGIGKNVTAEKEMEERFHAFKSYHAITDKDTVIFARMNLTANKCGDCSSVIPEISSDIISTADEFLSAVSETIPVCEDTSHMSNISRGELMELFFLGETTIGFEYRAQLQGNRPIWLKATVDMMKNPSTGDIEALYYIFDIDYEKNTGFVVNQLLAADYEFLGLIDVASGELMVFGDNKDTHGMARNGSLYDEEMPRVFRELIHEEYFDEAVRNMERSHIMAELETKEYYTCSFPATALGNTKAGRKQWKFSYLDSSKTMILTTRSDITDMYTAERDELTGLYNRPTFYRYAREILFAHPNESFVMIRLDIDRFKAYNDARGIKEGDRLLAEFGKEIRHHKWPELSLFGHIEADHFCLLFPKNELYLEKRLPLYYRWLESIVPDYRLISSIGIYEVNDHSVDVSLMSDRALLALRTVKESYENKVAWYDDRLRQKLRFEQTLIDEMELALQNEQFVLYYQPQINYDDNSLVGSEALVRWIHPERGIIPPGDFIPLFEKNGFILKLDAYVWEKACIQLRSWMDRGLDAIVPVSVNISRYDIGDPTICDRIWELVEKYSIPTSMLKLEITESAYMENPEQLLEMARRLQQMGFTVEMDDFGAGYSSLNTLKDVPVDILKLDMRFLSKGWDDSRGGLILSSVIRMARWLGIPVIAEGVETESQAEYLKSLSCRYMQGYLFAKPMPIAEFEELMKAMSAGGIKRSASFTQADELWSPETQDSLLFNRLMGGAAILEYDGVSAEILRANDRFYSELKTTRADYQYKQGSTLDRFKGENRRIYKAMLDEAISTGADAECEIQSLPMTESEKPFWTYNRVKLLSKSSNRFLFYLEVRNITRCKHIENTHEELPQDLNPMAVQAKPIFSNQELQFIAKRNSMMICRYYMETRKVESFYYSTSESTARPFVEENVPESTVASGVVSADTAKDFLAVFDMMFEGIPSGSGDFKLMTIERGYCWYHADYSIVYDNNGKPAYSLVTLFDVSEAMEKQAASEKWRAGISVLLAGAMFYAEINLTQNKVRHTEKRIGEMPSSPLVTIEDVTEHGLFGDLDIAAETEYRVFLDRQRLLGLFSENVFEDHFDYCLYSDNGASWMRISVAMSKYPDSGDIIAIVSYSSLDEQKLELEQLTHKAYHDALTGILNRDGFDKKAEELLSEYNPRITTAMFLIDLDNFKQVNDRLGHQSGDMVLKQVADTLKESFRIEDAVGRIGGDEFIVLVTGDFQQGALEKKAVQLISAMKLNLDEKKQVAISISVGVVFGKGKYTFDKLYRTADIALYSAKKAGKCCFHIINMETNEEQGLRVNTTQTDLISLQSLLEYAVTDEGSTYKTLTPYEALLQSIPGGVIILSITDRLRLTHCNDWQIKSFGYTTEELEALQRDDPYAIIHPDDIAPIKAALQTVVRGGRDNLAVTYRLRHKDGHYMYVQLNASVTERSKNETVLYGIQTDVESLMQLQKKL